MALTGFLSCSTSVLARIAERRPRTVAELEAISGVGDQKAERFGDAFLAILADTGD